MDFMRNVSLLTKRLFLDCEPTEVFLHGCHTRVSVPVLVNISCAFILDGFECLDSGKLMRVPHDAAIFHESLSVAIGCNRLKPIERKKVVFI